jgi:hypothetical protein
MAKWESCIVVHTPLTREQDDLIEVEYSTGERSVLRGRSAKIGAVIQNLLLKHWDLIGSCTMDGGAVDLYFLKRALAE